jgi:hypothetical protein
LIHQTAEANAHQPLGGHLEVAPNRRRPSWVSTGMSDDANATGHRPLDDRSLDSAASRRDSYPYPRPLPTTVAKAHIARMERWVEQRGAAAR